MKKLLLFFAVLLTALSASAENYILYTSSDGNVIQKKFWDSSIFGANIVSNTYKNGQGKILFDGDVTHFGTCAFGYDSNLTSVEIPNTVKSIGNGAFKDCSSLATVVIPNSVTEIGENVFKGCSSLTSVKIPNSVNKIGSYLFYRCI